MSHENEKEYRSLIEAARALATAAGAERRRHDLMERYETRIARPLASEAYDLAVEEQVDPALALEVVARGLGVQELEPPEVPEEARDVIPIEVAVGEERPAQAARERRLRNTFRRLRSLSDRFEDPEEVAINFLEAPDVGPTEYPID